MTEPVLIRPETPSVSPRCAEEGATKKADVDTHVDGDHDDVVTWKHFR